MAFVLLCSCSPSPQIRSQAAPEGASDEMHPIRPRFRVLHASSHSIVPAAKPLGLQCHVRDATESLLRADGRKSEPLLGCRGKLTPVQARARIGEPNLLMNPHRRRRRGCGRRTCSAWPARAPLSAFAAIGPSALDPRCNLSTLPGPRYGVVSQTALAGSPALQHADVLRFPTMCLVEARF